jgi:hypothetical protein
MYMYYWFADLPLYVIPLPDQIVPPGSKDMGFWYWKNLFYPAEGGEQVAIL